VVPVYPFLDLPLLQVSVKTPTKLKFHGGRGRGLLRNAMDDCWPESIKNRVSKGEFNSLFFTQFKEIWPEFEPKTRENHEIWKIINKETFMRSVSILLDDKLAINQKNNHLWFCSKVVSAAIWLEELS
jgi:Asparagine synthase